jgi:hypothetical protein
MGRLAFRLKATKHNVLGVVIPMAVEPIECSGRPCGKGNAANMVDLIDDPLKSAPIEAGASVTDPLTVADRRRPERLERVDPALLQLLRGPTQFVDILPREPGQSVDTLLGEPSKSADIDADEDTDNLAPGRGIVVGLLLSVSLWVMIGLGVWFIF